MKKTILLSSSSAFAASKYNMTEGVTPMSHAIFDLHMLIFYVCIGIFVIVFGAMGYCCIKHRKSKGAKAEQFHDNLAVEIAWTIVPTIILICMAIPATKVLIDIHDTGKSDVDIKIIGMQWRWKYEYLSEGISFMSNLSTPKRQIDGFDPKGKHYLREVDKPLVLPIHKKIRFLVTSSDVQHSWWVPAFGIKRDAIPGLLTTSWAKIEKTGVYRGKCAELCGMHHGFMPIVVYAVTENDYQYWLSSMKKHQPLSQKILEEMALHHKDLKTKSLPKQKPKPQVISLEDTMQKGQVVYSQHCVACHRKGGEGMPPVFKALKGSNIVTGNQDKVIDILLYGVAGKAMQAFGNILSDEQIAHVITYIRNSWGNGTKSPGIIPTKAVVQRRN